MTWLLNVLPCFAGYHESNITARDTKPISNCLLAHALLMQLSYLAHYSGVDSGFSMSFASSIVNARSRAPLSDHVHHIVELGTQKEMVRANAIWHIAAMKYLLCIGNRAIGEFPRNSMRSARLSIYMNFTVPKSIGCTLPQPTTIGNLCNFPPKSFGQWAPAIVAFDKALMLAFFRTILAICFCGNRCQLTATALTELLSLHGIIEVHKNLLILVPSLERVKRCQAFCIGNTGVIIP